MASSSSNILAGRVPCHEYITCHFQAGSLGFELRRVDISNPSSDPMLGNAIVARVVPGGQAEREKVQAYDCIITVNGEYIAFSSFEAISDTLRNASRPLTVIVARPWKSAWERIGADVEGVVKVGNLDKLSIGFGGVLNRWQGREFILSRTTLSYSDEGVLRKKIPLEEIINVFPLPTHDTEFRLLYQGKDVSLRTQGAEDKLMWLHAIESTRKGCFDNVQTVLKKLSGPSSTAVPAAQGAPPAVSAQKPTPQPPINRGPYHLLSRSMVVVKTDTGANGATSYSLPPPVVVPSFPPIDLSVERIVLGTG